MPSNVFINGQTAQPPALQDVLRGDDAYYQRNLARIGQDIEIEKIKGVANIGADRLEAYGPRGKWWADRLRADPIAAYAAAVQFGGFALIEKQLQRADAAGVEAQLGDPMNPTDFQAWLESGPAGSQAMGTAAAAQALAGQRGATADAMRQFLDGGGQTGIGDGTGAYPNNDNIPNIAALQAIGLVKPEIARAEVQLMKYQRDPGEQAVKEIQSIAQPFITKLTTMNQDWKFVRDAAFVNSSKHDAWLLKLFVRSVEPGLMVTQAETGDVVRATTSDLGQISARVMRTLDANGLMTPTTRRILAESIDSGFKARASASLEFMDGLQNEAGELMKGQPAGINVKRALIGDDAPRASLQEMIETPYDFSTIGPADNEDAPTGKSTRPKPKAKIGSNGQKIDWKWDEDMGEWYLEDGE